MEKVLDPWVIEEKDLPERSGSFCESIFSLGNGYMGSRGFDEEEEAEKDRLCTYIAGVYDYYSAGKTDIVNTPNFWKTRIFVNGQPFSLKNGGTEKYEKNLELKRGVISRRLVWKSPNGEKTKIETQKFISLSNPHVAVLRVSCTPLNYSGEICIKAAIDADVRNNLIDDDQMKNEKNIFDFLTKTKIRTEDGVSAIELETAVSRYAVCEGFGTRLLRNGSPEESSDTVCSRKRFVETSTAFSASQNETYEFFKYISVWTSRDTRKETLWEKVRQDVEICRRDGFDALLAAQEQCWAGKWKRCDIVIDGDAKSQQGIRYSLFQLIQIDAENDPSVSIGARGIFHGRYKGCVFWDTEIFMQPFYLYTNPKAARNLLLYRYLTLAGAERNAAAQNMQGARFAWMSAIDGVEQCDSWDIGLSEVHITADIAYAVVEYYRATGDAEFLRDYGLELLIETARYWAGRFSYDGRSDRYNLLFVKGPDEYGGVGSNNLYTVEMARFNLEEAGRLAGWIKTAYPESYQKTAKKIGFDLAETEKWKDILQKAVVPCDRGKKLYLEDENFCRLEPLDVKKAKCGDEPLYKKISFDRLQRYRVLKQPDVLLLMYLLPDRFDGEEQQNAWQFYEPLTAHDSSLSFGIHAALAARLGLTDVAYRYFLKSACLDIDNILGNTGNEGLHPAAAGASWQALIYGFAGVRLHGDGLVLEPRLPKEWNSLAFHMVFRGNLLSFRLTHRQVEMLLEEGETGEIPVTVEEKTVALRKGEKRALALEQEREYAV